MRTTYQRRFLIWATLSLLFVLMVGSKTLAANAKLLALDGAWYNGFGASISISGDVAVVGAPGSPFENPTTPYYPGAAYVFRWNGSTWVEEQKLFASDGAAGDTFGMSVSISGDVVMVGAANRDDKGTNSGAVYVFRWNGSTSTWEQTQKLLASDGSEGDCFGFSVFMSGDVAVVGAVFFKNADNPNWIYQRTGAAYVFRFNGSTWVEEQRLLASDGRRFDFAGFSVFISGDVAAMAAPNHRGNAVGSGAVYVFRFNGSTSTWEQTQELLASDGAFNDSFGNELFISGDMALVGAPERNDNGLRSGAVYVFRWNGSTWVEVQKLLASDGSEGDYFGTEVSISGDVAVVGATGDYNNNGLRSGSAYIFRWNGSTWEEKQKLLAPDGGGGDQFGASVSISGDVALVGAYLDDDLGTDSGSVYVYNDYDSDGISNPVDSDPFTPSVLFSDLALGGATSGQIMSLDPGITIDISDAPNPTEGVRVLVSGPLNEIAKIRIDGSQGLYKLSPGTYILTSGSVRLQVVEGEAEVEFTIGGETVLLRVDGTAVIHETIVGGELQGLVVQAVEGTVTLNDAVVPPGKSITYVSIDIKPASASNCIKKTDKGQLPIAILASSQYDVTRIDESTILLEGSISPIHSSLDKDANGDTIPDLVLHFLMADVVGVLADGVTLTITGETIDGQLISGGDVINLTGGPNCP